MQSGQNLILKEILAEAIKRQSIDLHFSVGNYPIIKVDAKLVLLEDREMITQDFMEEFVSTILSPDQKNKLISDREIIITHDFDRGLRFKINIFFQKDFFSATLRHIPDRTPTIDSLKLDQQLKEFCQSNRGLIIVSGPFGSGKSATAAAILEEINQTSKRYIITIEKPIEYLFVNNKSIIEQREVGRDTASYEKALSYFQEEGADVLFLQELNDAKIIPTVLEIARSSSLVIATIGADSASRAIARIMDSFQSFDQERIRNLLSTGLKAVVCQKLLPRIGGGIICVQEVMVVNEAIKNLIATGNISQLDNIIQTSRQYGMVSFDQLLASLVRKQIISSEDAIENANDVKLLENAINE